MTCKKVCTVPVYAGKEIFNRPSDKKKIDVPIRSRPKASIFGSIRILKTY